MGTFTVVYQTSPTRSTPLYPHSPELLSAAKYTPLEMIVVATKLRHSILFTEALIYTVGQWWRLGDKIPKLKKENRAIYKAIVASEAQILERLAVLKVKISHACAENHTIFDTVQTIERQHFAGLESKPLRYVGYYRDLLKAFQKKDHSRPLVNSIIQLLNALLANNLVGDREAVAGVGWYAESFLCATIDDEDLPWDQAEMDW